MSDTQKELVPLSAMVDMDPVERARHQLRIMDGLLARAVAAQKFSEALSITKAAGELLKTTDRVKRARGGR